jgi:NodT family efflux transporter outer membrane factor (OMF) lipoprotein
VKVSEHFGGAPTNGAAFTGPDQTITQSAPPDNWWSAFHDPELDRLIEEAVRKNYDLQIATARVREARFQRSITAADLFPQVETSAGVERALGSKNVGLPLGGGGSGGAGAGGAGSKPATPARNAAGNAADSGSGSASGGRVTSAAPNTPLTPFGEGGLPGVTSDLYQVGFDASWELDVFGGNRRRVEAATADVESAVESRRDMIVTLVAEVARNYLELRGAQERVSVARENLAAQNQILELTRSMQKSGLATDLEVARAAGLAATTASTIPPLEAIGVRSIHTLSTLLAEEPNALSAELVVERPLPISPPVVPVGLPSALLLRRPDLRRAERQIAAATARVGSAKADLFPRFFLTGSAGLDSTSASQLFDWESHYFLISPTVTWHLFDAGRIVSNIGLQKANQEEALTQYRGAILTALREVEDALTTYATEQAHRAPLLEALKQNRIAALIARERYEHGLVDFLDVLDAQKNVLSAQDAKTLSDQSVATDLVALYKALGGGWQVADEKSTARETREDPASR